MSSLSHTWRDELRTAYPKIFARPCELSVGPGWRVLVDELCTALQWQTDHNGAPQLVAIEVKSKLGELRFYAKAAMEAAEPEPAGALHIRRHERQLVISRSAGSRAQDAVTALASALSRRTCEECGATGTQLADSWGLVSTRCETHRDQGDEALP
jgi:hypothetical protein